MKYSTKNPRPLPPLDVLNEWFSYEPETGALTWKKVKEMDRKNKVGDTVGCLHHGYRCVELSDIGYKVHRICYYMGTGKEPKNIDHINGVRDDNRLSNLRCVTNAENMKNQSRYNSNTSGVTGVNYDKRGGFWRAYISIGGVLIYLPNHETGKKYFTDKIDAIYARYWAERDAGYHENHGRIYGT